MEIIKQIKAAESQVKEVIEQAKSDAIKIAEGFAAKREQTTAAAADKRRGAIDAAIADAEVAGKGQVDELMAEGSAHRKQMQESAKGKVGSAVNKVVETVKAI